MEVPPPPAGHTGRMQFPDDAMAFYRALEADNSREFWLANKKTYDSAVKAPMTEVAALLEDEFGEGKLFRPNRDVRFSADKSPYKTHQGLYVATGPACGFYVEVNAREAMAGAGFYQASPAGLAAYRAAVADEPGALLERIVGALADDGWLIGGDELATAPRGFKRDHPRIELLRKKSLHAMREVEADGVAGFAKAVADIWRKASPLVDWVSARLTDPQ